MANVGGHASQRDTCHVIATYALLRRWEASPPTLPRFCCCDAGKGYGSARQREWRRLLHVTLSGEEHDEYADDGCNSGKDAELFLWEKLDEANSQQGREGGGEIAIGCT